MTQFVILHTWPMGLDTSLMPCVYDSEAEAQAACVRMTAGEKPGHRYSVAHVPDSLHVRDDSLTTESVATFTQGAVEQNPATGRWFITMGHPGFNSPANNREGYLTRERAEAAQRRYGSRR